MTASFRSIALVCALVATTEAHGQVFTLPRSDQEAIEQYFEGLRQRRLFSLAETVCLRRLSDRALDPKIRARYAVELSRTFSEHARYVAAFDEQTELLEQAREAVLKILGRGIAHPQQVLLEAQAQFVTAREVELNRWRFELQPFDTAPRDRAMLLSTRLVADFEQLDEKLNRELRVPNRTTPPGGLTAFQLRGLQRVLRYRLAAVLLDRAKLLERRSPDRAEALVKADAAFRRLASGAVIDDLAWRSRLGLVETIRLRGETTIAQKLLNGMLNDQPAPQVLDEIVAEQAEILIVEKKLTDAADLLRQHRLERRGLNGRLSYLNAAVLLQLWKIARENDESKLADEVLQEASTSVARAQVEADGYWAARARQLLASANSTKDYGAVAGPLVQRAQSLFGAGKASEAAIAFEQAFAAARQEGRTDAAVEISYTAGSVLLKLDRFDEAAAFFEQTQTLQPDGPRAAHANLLQAWCKGRVYQQQPTSAHREAYAAALQQHRESFPDTSTFGDATWMLAGLEEGRGQTVQAFKLFAQVPNGHAHAAESRVAVARCAESILERLKRADQPRGEWEAALIRQLDIFVQPVLAQPTLLTGPQAELLLRTGRLHLHLESPDYETADQLLLHIQTNAKPDEAPADVELAALDDVVSVETLNAAAGLRIVALVGKGDVDAARRELEQIASQGVNSLCDVLDGLTTAATRLDQQSQWSIGQLQLRTVELAKIDERKLSDSDRRRFRNSLAGAYELAGLPARAAAILTAFLKANPDDNQLRQRLAELLLQSNQPTDLRTAREHFRKLEAIDRAGTPAWLRTRLQVIRASIALKETDEAKKLLKVTRLLHRNLGGPALKREYDAVEASLK
jgi:tetratricopeptide (TPR) repeat protein